MTHPHNPTQDQYQGEPGSVLEFDIYHAETLLPMSDDAVVEKLLSSYLPAALGRTGGRAGAGAAAAAAVDASVLRFRSATTVFSPGSAAALPPICTSIPNVFVAGDCVAQGPGTHGAKGLSQEKAYVSGLQVRLRGWAGLVGGVVVCRLLVEAAAPTLASAAPLAPRQPAPDYATTHPHTNKRQAGNSAARLLGLTPAVRVLPVEPDEPHVAAAKGAARASVALRDALRATGKSLLMRR